MQLIIYIIIIILNLVNYESTRKSDSIINYYYYLNCTFYLKSFINIVVDVVDNIKN